MKSYLNKFLQFLSFLFVINSSQQILINNRLRFNELKTFLIGKKFLYRKIISIRGTASISEKNHAKDFFYKKSRYIKNKTALLYV
ncbi:hypothetical protein ACI2KY_29065, partial [Bacillus thuringiensis]|nr:hypothetical protein [Bacillus cereus]